MTNTHPFRLLFPKMFNVAPWHQTMNEDNELQFFSGTGGI